MRHGYTLRLGKRHQGMGGEAGTNTRFCHTG